VQDFLAKGKYNQIKDMTVEENIPLAQYTTFKMGGPARYFSVVHNEDEVVEAVKFSKDTEIPFS
jgi:UDP-N-acetylmuramate dehydrogenase